MKELLSVQELSELLVAVGEGRVPTVSAAASGERTIRPHDFRQSVALSRDQLRAIQHLHQGVAVALSSALGDLLHAPVEAGLAAVGLTTYGAFNSALPSPACVQVFAAAPGGHRGLLALEVPLALSLVEQMLGAQAHALDVTRPLTAIEQAILASPIRLVLERLAAAWSPAAPVEFKPETMEMNPRLVQLLGVRESVLRLVFVLAGEACAGDLNLCLPLAFVEELIPRQKADISSLLGPQEGREHDPALLRRALGAAPVHVAVELGRAAVSILDLIQLQPGDVVRLERRIGESLDGTVEGKPCFAARPGLVGPRLGVQIIRPPARPGKGTS